MSDCSCTMTIDWGFGDPEEGVRSSEKTRVVVITIHSVGKWEDVPIIVERT
jgi:hypothetical protein